MTVGHPAERRGDRLRRARRQAGRTTAAILFWLVGFEFQRGHNWERRIQLPSERPMRFVLADKSAPARLAVAFEDRAGIDALQRTRVVPPS
jgi:hypothetical protein